MVGRPRGTKKDPNRRRVINPNRRKIDFEGKQYFEWINKVYELNNDGSELIIDGSFTVDRIKRRPKGRPKITIVSDYEKVRNPESGRLIKTNTPYFRKLVKKYDYDEVGKKFLLHVTDPKNPKIKLVKNAETFNSYLDRGYIYDKRKLRS